jgi:outer membrane protein OmpA-like peptidoglycan-associated protein
MTLSASRLFAAAVVAVAMACCTACGDEPREPTTVRIGVTASANEPHVGLTKSVVDRLSAAVDKGETRLVVYRAGDEVGGSMLDQDFSVRDGKDLETDPAQRKIVFDERLDRLTSELEQISAEKPRLDPLTLLSDMASVPGPAVLVLHSSGLQTVDPLDLTRLGLDIDVASVVASVPDDALPDLAGKEVIFTGLGQTAGPQQALPPAWRQALADVWLGICRKFNASSCTYDPERVGGAPVSRTEAPTVTVGEVVEQGASVHVPNALLFEPNTDQLAPGAREVLEDVAARFTPRTTARVVARTATSASGQSAVDLTTRRGERLVAELTSLGVSRSAFTEVVGAGFNAPLEPDTDSLGDLIPTAAARNRVVVLELAASEVG